MSAPTVAPPGRALCRFSNAVPGAVLVKCGDSDPEVADGPAAALRIVGAWARRRAARTPDSLHYTIVTWENVPDGFVPPEQES